MFLFPINVFYACWRSILWRVWATSHIALYVLWLQSVMAGSKWFTSSHTSEALGGQSFSKLRIQEWSVEIFQPNSHEINVFWVFGRLELLNKGFETRNILTFEKMRVPCNELSMKIFPVTSLCHCEFVTQNLPVIK